MIQPLSQQKYREAYFQIYAFFYRRVTNSEDIEDLTKDTLNEFLIFKEKNIEHDKPYMYPYIENDIKID